MDFLSQHEELSYWLLQYGSLALFGLLALGIVALPIPDETLLVLAGVFISEEKLHLIPTLLASYLGSMCGISISFMIGASAGKYFINHYGGWIGFTEEKRERVHKWFKHYGKWTLVFGYFIPGVRHVTGILAGMGKLEFRSFALYAYSGAFVWCSTFLSIGYFLGDYWVHLFENIEIDVYILAIFVLILFVAALLWRYFSSKKPL